MVRGICCAARNQAPMNDQRCCARKAELFEVFCEMGDSLQAAEIVGAPSFGSFALML